MAAVDLLSMEPIVRAAGELRRQLVVLHVASADKHLKTVVRNEAQGCLRLDLSCFPRGPRAGSLPS